MAADRVAVAANLGLQIPGHHVLQPHIKMEEEDEEEGDRPCVIQAGRLRGILGWPGLEQVKQEPEEEGPPCWVSQGQEHLRPQKSPHSGWGPPRQPEELILRQRGARRREQQVPVLFDEMEVHSPETDRTLLDRRRYLRREAKLRLEKEGSSLNAVPVRRITKTSRRGTNWSYAEVIDLLDIWGQQRIQQVLQSSHRNMDTFQVIANEMAKRGHERTAQECRTKTKTLRREYKKVKANNCSGAGRITCPFYDQLEQILDSGVPQPTEQAQGYGPREESGGNDSPLCGLEEGGPHKSEDCLEPQDFFDPSAQFSIELVDSLDPATTVCKTEDNSEEPISTPRPASETDRLLRPLPPAPPSLPGSPATTGSTADMRPTPCHSPFAEPTGLSAAERLASIRNRHKKTRNDLAAELATAADLRMQAATDRILSALDGYAEADLEARKKDRVGTEQIIAIMQRQTDLLELLIRRQQLSTPAAAPSGPPWQTWQPRTAQSSPRPAGPSSSRLNIARRPLTPRARTRRRPQNYSP